MGKRDPLDVITELEALCDVAAPGPWAEAWIGEALKYAHSQAVPWARLADTSDCFRPGVASAPFIARSRTALPAALEALRRALMFVEGTGMDNEDEEIAHILEPLTRLKT